MASYVLQNELAGEWESYEFLSCPVCPGMTTVFPLCQVCHHTGICSSSARADWIKAIYMEQMRPCVLCGRACLEKKSM